MYFPKFPVLTSLEGKLLLNHGEMGRTSAFYFLCDLLRGIPTGRHADTDGTFRWSEFIALTHEYRVSAAAAYAIEYRAPRKSCPDGVRAFLLGRATHSRQRNERVRNEAIEIARTLNEIEVEPLFMKGGAYLVTDLYPDIAMREMSDLDILVPSATLDNCIAALNERGIAQLTDYVHPRAHHHPQLGRADLPVPIELHHAVLAYPHCDFLTSEEMQASTGCHDKHGVRFSVPSPTLGAVHNIAHAQLNDHDSLYGRIDLRGLLDLAQLSNVYADEIDWSHIEGRFLEHRRRHALEYHFQWARRLGAKVPSLDRIGSVSQLLFRRAAYQVRKPELLSLSVRLLRPFVLLRRELADSGLRRRLAGNVLKRDWWRRHLRMLTGA